MSISKRLRDARRAAKLTQQQVADVFEIKREAVSLWESEGAKGTKPDIRKLERLATLYNRPISELLGGERLPDEGAAEGSAKTEENKKKEVLSKDQEFAVSLIARMDKETKAAFIALFERLVPDRREENVDPHPLRRLGSDIPPDPHDTRLHNHDQIGELEQSKEMKNK